MASSNGADDDSSCRKNQEIDSEDVALKAQEYLDSNEANLIADPKLRREKQKINDLLASYKKLIDKLDSKFENAEVKAETVKKLRKIPEIYAILHPELYRDPREEEKKRLISKFAKRQFLEVDKIVPSIYRTPPVNVNDVRQEEKERLIKILASCPARFLNSCDSPVSTKKVKRVHSYSLSYDSFRNQREAEKERLSKILATTATYYRKHLDGNGKSKGRGSFDKSNEIPVNGLSVKKADMVRVGEYSPLTSKERSRTLFGYGEHEERRTQLLAERRKEYKNYLSSTSKEDLKPKESLQKVNKPLATTDDIEDDEDERSRCHSVATQTDDLAVDNTDGKEEAAAYSTPPQNINNYIQPTPPHQVYYLSPREKLMSDLHGVSHCFPGGTMGNSKPTDNLDARMRQAAYAKALQEQIDEKKKFEEDRRRKERMEDELIEQRIRMQQEKFQSEVSSELKKKQDWIAQRQSQEEILRRKMLEMKIEAQELRKQHNRKNRIPDNADEREFPVPPPHTNYSEPSHSRNFSKPQTLSEPMHRRDLTGRVSMRSLPTRTYKPRWNQKEEGTARIPKLPEKRYDGIDRHPLLEADRQNILSSYANIAPQVSSYQPKENLRPKANTSSGLETRVRDKEKAEALLRAPLDFRIDRPPSPPKISQSQMNDRPPSPPIPALRTRDIINNNSKILEQKWKIPGQGRELDRTITGRDNILTQLGAFRRQLQEEHLKLEARLQQKQPT